MTLSNLSNIISRSPSASSFVPNMASNFDSITFVRAGSDCRSLLILMTKFILFIGVIV